MTPETGDEHTGVSEAAGIPYTYEHAEEDLTTVASLYRVTSTPDLVDRPPHRNIYFVPGRQLDQFLCEIPERIVDVRPTTPAAAREHLSEYGADPEEIDLGLDSSGPAEGPQ